MHQQAVYFHRHLIRQFQNHPHPSHLRHLSTVVTHLVLAQSLSLRPAVVWNLSSRINPCLVLAQSLSLRPAVVWNLSSRTHPRLVLAQSLSLRPAVVRFPQNLSSRTHPRLVLAQSLSLRPAVVWNLSSRTHPRLVLAQSLSLQPAVVRFPQNLSSRINPCLVLAQSLFLRPAVVWNLSSSTMDSQSSSGERDIVSMYLHEEALREAYIRTPSDGVSVNNCSSLSLVDYYHARLTVCLRKHGQPCHICPPLLSVAEKVLRDGLCTLRDAFDVAYPDVTYNVGQAKRKILQMPLVSIRIGNPSSGTSCTFLMERVDNT